MRDNFNHSLELVLQSEGGFVDDPADPGGATNKGITFATYKKFDPAATVEMLKHIPDDDVAAIYRQNYWNEVRGDTLHYGVDYCVFDYAVNSGPERAKHTLLQVLGGPDRQTIIKICQARLVFLKGLKTFARFGKGWTNRVNFVQKHALRMVRPEQEAPMA